MATRRHSLERQGERELARLRSERGQTFVEYTMILGLVTAIIGFVTALVVPAVSWVVVRLVNYLYIYLS